MTKRLSNKLYLKKQLYDLRMNEGTTVLEHLNFFNKIIYELLTVEVNIDEENKVLIVLSSLPESYDHIITTMLYGKKTLILEEITLTLLSNEIKKRLNQEQTRSSLVVTGRKGREGKKGPDSSKACHFCHREGHWKNDCKHRQEWLKKGQATEAGVALSDLEKTEVLMAFNEDNTSQGKGWIFDSGSTVHVCYQKELFNYLIAKEEGIVKMMDGLACEVIRTEIVKVTERDGTMRDLEAI